MTVAGLANRLGVAEKEVVKERALVGHLCGERQIISDVKSLRRSVTNKPENTEETRKW